MLGNYLAHFPHQPVISDFYSKHIGIEIISIHKLSNYFSLLQLKLTNRKYNQTFSGL